ncbi:hypothetical protein Tco_0532571 [Tanacetum coccineum]
MTNNQALAFHLDSPMAMKLRKRENNLMNWKWDQVIVIKDSDDEVDLFDSEGISLWEEDNHNIDIVSNGVIVGEKVVDEIPNATVHVDDGVIGGEFADDEVPKERVKITGKRKLYQAFYEAEDDV